MKATHRPAAALSGCSLLALILGVGAVELAGATRVPHATPQQLVNASAAIVIGTVTALAYETSRSGEPLTTVRLQRLDVVTGKEQLAPYLDRGLTLMLAGGLTKQGWQQTVVGLPSLKLGHTYLLFLQGGEWTLSPIAGWTQGVLQVVPGPEQKRYLLTYEGELVTGMTADAVVATPLVQPRQFEKEKAAIPEPKRGQLEIATDAGTGEAAYQSAAKDQKTSLYRENNQQQLIEQDEKQARARIAEVAPPVDREWLTQAGKALSVERAIATLQDLSAKGDKRAPRVLKLEATPVPADNTQQPVPTTKKN